MATDKEHFEEEELGIAKEEAQRRKSKISSAPDGGFYVGPYLEKGADPLERKEVTKRRIKL